MPTFKTTYNILVKPWEDELWNPNWMDSNTIQLPPYKEWDYKEELTIDKVSVWEVLYDASGGKGVYAAWDPYAEFYLVTTGWIPGTKNDRIIETYYGPEAGKKVYFRAKELNMPLIKNKIWVEPEKMWLYKNS